MKRRILLGFFAYLLSGFALAAYPCPNGPGPGERQVGSTGGSHGVGVVPMCERTDSSGSVEAGHQWASRWGAIYLDHERAVFGASEKMQSKGKARKAAEKNCIANGGRKCRMIMDSRNQCSAFAGNQLDSFVTRGSTKEDAESAALAGCLRNSGQECALLYSGCSQAVRIR